MKKEQSVAMDTYSYGGIQPDPLTILAPENVPEVGKRDDMVDRPNFADIKDTVDKTLVWVKMYKEQVESQAMRMNAIQEMDLSDEMWRAAATASQLQSSESQNRDTTQSNVTSVTFFNAIRTITSGEQAVILGNTEDLPVIYEPVPGCTDYRQQEARHVADAQNAVLEHCWEVDKMKEKMGDILFFGAKYGNLLCVMDWERLVEERNEIVPKISLMDKLRERITGQPTSPTKFTVKNKKRNVKNNPTLKWYDQGRYWLDTTIDSVQNQSCVGWRDQYQIGDIYSQQASGEWMNADKITRGQLYNDDQGGLADTIRDRKTNIGIADDNSSINTLWDVYTFWIRLPVDIKTGKWEPESKVQTWFKTVWCGDINGNPVCLQLEPNMHWNHKVPATLFHTHRDDAGACHISYATLMKAIYAMQCSLFNEALDNARLLSKKPWIIERGSIAIKDKKFTAGGNSVWYKTPGSANPQELKVDSIAALTDPLLNRVEGYAEEAMGTNKVLNGESLGARTSAQEAGSVFEQALKPALEDAKFKANQILPFIAEWCLEMTRQFADPDETYFITRGHEIIEVKPTELYGDLSIRITAVKRFQDSILRRREEDVFLNQIYPLMGPIMSPKGKINFFSQIAKNRGFEGVEQWFDTQGDVDAKNWASNENQVMYAGQQAMPKEGENHDVHLSVHKPFAEMLRLLPPEQLNPMVLQNITVHIQMTEQMKAASMAGAQAPQVPGMGPQQPGQQQMQPENQNGGPAMEGNAGAEMISGQNEAMQS